MGTTYRYGSSSSHELLVQPESGLHTLYLMTPNDHRLGRAPHHTRSHLQSDQGIDSGFSKYLKAAQQLLGEVVNVGIWNGREKEKVEGGSDRGESRSGKREGPGYDDDELISSSNSQRQELRMKKAKLVNMLDEVEQRYREYNKQMQIAVSSFEQAVGMGSAEMYTGLTLRTISKQFRCLKDGISTQIKAAAKRLGEDHDHQLMIRQQRPLQKLGMMPPPTSHHNAWRHQRGLPERAVSVLRAWLFDHFLHPYPKDSDKHMLAKQTGLTRSQVSNWFINARVRLWKPMVEEMYLEEIKQHDGVDNMKTTVHCINVEEEPNKVQLLRGGSKSIISSPNNQYHVNIINPLDSHTLCTNIVEAIPNKPKPNSYPSRSGNPNNFGTRFNPQHLVNVDHANSARATGFSLTLGLPHCHETLARHSFHSDQGFMSAIQTSHYMGMGITSASPSDSTTIDNRKRFVAPFLPNFVV